MAGEAVLICSSHHRALALHEAIEAAGWRLRVHADPAAALDDIRRNAYDALFCDERLRGATPGGFLSWHRRLAPDAAFYVVATVGNELATSLRGRPTDVLPYPLTPEAVPPPPSTRQWRPRVPDPVIPLEGDTGTVPLGHLVELLGLNDGQAIVDTPAGAIHLAKGRVEHANYVAAPGAEALVGMKALAELVSSEELKFRVLPYRPPPQRSVDQPIMTAVVEAARQKDESLRNRRIMAVVKERHPMATGLAIGYPLNAAPNDTWGAGAAAHGLLQRYAQATKGLSVLAKPTHLALEGEGFAWALVALANGLVLSGTTARGKSVSLLSAMVAGVRAVAAEGD